MPEDIGTIINKGLSTWTRNLNICIPFVFNLLIGGLLALIAFFIFVVIFIVPPMSGANIDPETISPEQMMDIFSSVFSENILIVAVFLLGFILLLTFVESYFTAGAIGMAKNALIKGDTSLGDMFSAGNQNAFNLFLASILISLITLLGIVFLIPGFLVVEDFGMLLTNPESVAQSATLLVFGFLFWGIYIAVISIILAVVVYALVVDRLDPISALETGFRFFMNNKLDVFLVWMILVALSIALSLVGSLFNSVEALAIIWTFVNFIISVVVIPPLTTIWFTRLYLDRTGNMMYDHQDLLMYP